MYQPPPPKFSPQNIGMCTCACVFIGSSSCGLLQEVLILTVVPLLHLNLLNMYIPTCSHKHVLVSVITTSLDTLVYSLTLFDAGSQGLHYPVPLPQGYPPHQQYNPAGLSQLQPHGSAHVSGGPPSWGHLSGQSQGGPGAPSGNMQYPGELNVYS